MIDKLGKTLAIGSQVLAAKGYKGDTGLYLAEVIGVTVGSAGDYVALRFEKTKAKVLRSPFSVIALEY